LRSVVSRAYDKVTLRSLVERIAGELELEVCGEIVDVPIAHITQSQETTLAFLRRLAQAYGYAFSVRPPKLVFYDLVQLEASKVVMRYGRTDLASYDLKGSNQNTYVACEVSYLDPTTKELRKVRVEAAHARTKTVVSGSVAGDVIIPTRTLRQGSSGDDVKSWQTWVTSQGCDVGTVDGKFGAKTRRGTVVYQQRLEASPDGVVGPETVRLSREAGWGSAAASAGDGVKVEVAGRVLRKTIRVETIEQAELQARALLLDANRLRVNGTLAMSGDPCLVAGATIELGSMGRVSGAYLIQSSAHRVGRSSGYSTSVEVTCV
jgi:phage protein D